MPACGVMCVTYTRRAGAPRHPCTRRMASASGSEHGFGRKNRLF
ncbi:hypothetical protein C7S15_2689 [Burkholderia cepacia]|nr:hypothetical protein [Burkholderia cepacia]